MTRDKIIAEVQSVSKRGGSTFVDVAVTGPPRLSLTKKLRARAKALQAAGLVTTTVETIADVPAGEIGRATRIVKERESSKAIDLGVPVVGELLEEKVYTVQVNNP